MKTWQQTLFGILIGLTLSAVILLLLHAPDGKGIELLPAPTLQPLVVHVVGEVVKPGVYEVQRNSRVMDAVEVAGGFSPDANTSAVNLADMVQDGSMIVIPALGETSTGYEPVDKIITSENKNEQPVNINTANQEEIESLPNIGPSKAADIIAFRMKNGKFVKIEDIMNVPGISQATFDKIKEFIVVD